MDDSGQMLGPNYHVPALEKGLDILECLAARGVPLTQAQVARALGRRPTELFRMLTALERRGYIQRDPLSGAYRLTMRLYELGHAHSPYQGLLRAAERPMRGLTEEVRQSCHLSVIHHGQLFVLAEEQSPTRISLSVEVGSSIALLNAASGRLLLAYLDPSRREKTLAQDTDFPRLPVDEQAVLLDHLALIRSRGYETARSETIEGISDLAVLVGTEESRIQAALTIAALVRDHEAFLAEALPALRRSAESIACSTGLLVAGL
ncbi:MAG: IclR family transcriptional regulator [Thermomicrobiales bacterium]